MNPVRPPPGVAPVEHHLRPDSILEAKLLIEPGIVGTDDEQSKGTQWPRCYAGWRGASMPGRAPWRAPEGYDAGTRASMAGMDTVGDPTFRQTVPEYRGTWCREGESNPPAASATPDFEFLQRGCAGSRSVIARHSAAHESPLHKRGFVFLGSATIGDRVSRPERS